MHHTGKPADAAPDIDDAEISALVEADFNTMIEESMAEARALLSDDPDELAYVEANHEQLTKGQALQTAAQKAFNDGDLEAAAEYERQKNAELAEVLARAGKRGGPFTRFVTRMIVRRLK